MKRYEILEHRADLKLRVFGKNKKELFSNALFAITESTRPEIKNQKSKIKIIEIKSKNLEILLVDFLSEILYLIQVNKEIYTNIKFQKFSETELKAEISGQKVERFGEDIKAVTYHSLDVRQKEDGSWEATILFDV